ncbi:hypothetical protein M3148_05755 [Georgenia satyanarayanai]|nr:hypothetical protein [Georgenia satyanarayanai]
MSITNADQPSLRLTAAYDAGGNLTRQALPGGIEQNYTYDRAGQLTDLTYTGEGAEGRFEWFAFNLTRDADGNIIGDTAPGRARTFTIDRADRLTHVTDTIDTVDDASTCTTRSYTFDANGNRTTTTATGAVDACPTQGATSRTWVHDTADRVLSGANSTGSYVYDPLGRQTTLPGVDTPTGPAAGNLQVGYYDTDLVRTTTQNGATTTYQLDPAARRSTTTHTTGTSTTTTVRHYGDTSDNPAWATKTTPTGTETTRYLPGLAGGLALEITGTDPALLVSDPHGTTSTTIPIPTTSSSYTTASTPWQRTDEYGNPLDTHPSATGVLPYAWHGKDERATDTTGLSLMGVRLYNPVTGLFTSRDPIPGGNTTAYAYPQDPINNHDLDGQKRRPRSISKQPTWWQRHGGKVLTVGTIAACVVASVFVCGAISVGAAFVSNSRIRRGHFSFDRRGFINDAAWIVAGGAAGRALSGSLRLSAISRYRRPAPRHSARHDPRGHVTRIDWRQTRRNMGANLVLGTAGAAGASVTRRGR